jgi:tetratricopeptide (TPR) repeat protein
MERTRHITAALFVTTFASAAFGVAACSKGDEATPQQKPPAQAQEKPLPPPPASAPGQPTDGEGFVANVAPKITGSYADGEAAYRNKNYADAIAIFEGYTERRPGNAWGHYMLGLSAWKHGDLTKSEAAFEKALSIDPHHVKSLMNLSRVLLDQKRHDDAVARLTRAAEINSESADVFRLLGRTYHAQHKTDEAVEAYRRAIDLDERDAWSLNNLGLLFLEIQRADEALPLLAGAVELRNDVPEFHNNLGMALEHTGRFKAAATAYAGALTSDPGYEKAKQNLARVEAVKGGPEEPLEEVLAALLVPKRVVIAEAETAIK